jgi:hypothetical protein
VSFDIEARCSHCGSTLASWDPTYNYSKLFTALGIHPKDWHGKPAREYAEALAAAHARLLNNLEDFGQFDARGGWGTAGQLVPCLLEMAQAFARAGEALVVSQ